MRRLFTFTGITITLLVAFYLAPQATFACSPSPDHMDYTLEDRIENAPIIFTGTITEGFWMLEGSPGAFVSDALIEVDTVLKGEAYALEHVYGFGQGPDCASIVHVGQTSIFFAERNQDGTLDAVYLTVGDATWSATDASINTIINITGQQDVPIPLPWHETTLRWLQTHGLWLSGIAGGMVIILLMVGWFKKHRDPRKPKAKRG